MKSVPPSNIHFFQKSLLKWYSENTRPYPWVGIKDPYKIWLSEIILQQTRVEQGLPYYQRITAAFPTVHDLAHAEEERVFKLWQGLGYYNRCKHMIATARIVAEEHGGVFPKSYDELLRLPGVGPYTAAAVASFAYNIPKAVVDGNVERVLSRFFEMGTPVNTGQGKKEFTAIANKLLDQSRPNIYNQAIMDLGATVCTPRKPQCESCPLQSKCQAFKHNSIAQFPVKKRKLKRVTKYLYYFVLRFDGRFYVKKRPMNGIWPGLYEFYLWENKTPKPLKDLCKLTDLRKVVGEQEYKLIQSKKKKHVLTHRDFYLQFLLIDLSQAPLLPKEYILVTSKEMDLLPFPQPLASFLMDIQG